MNRNGSRRTAMWRRVRSTTSPAGGSIARAGSTATQRSLQYVLHLCCILAAFRDLPNISGHCNAGAHRKLSLLPKAAASAFRGSPRAFGPLACQTCGRALPGCGVGCLLRAGLALLSRHVLRGFFPALAAVFLAQALEVFEHFRRHAFGHAVMVAPKHCKVYECRAKNQWDA